MTLEELEGTLPNGLHDAEVHRFTVDYENRALTIDLAVWVGNMGLPKDQREAYREARIQISGLQFFISEPPDPRYPFSSSRNLTIDGCDKKDKLEKGLLKALASEVFIRSLWVQEWNAFMHIAAKEASIQWTGAAAVRS